jgi:hypothetical protein
MKTSEVRFYRALDPTPRRVHTTRHTGRQHITNEKSHDASSSSQKAHATQHAKPPHHTIPTHAVQPTTHIGEFPLPRNKKPTHYTTADQLTHTDTHTHTSFPSKQTPQPHVPCRATYKIVLPCLTSLSSLASRLLLKLAGSQANRVGNTAEPNAKSRATEHAGLCMLFV